MGLIIEGGGLTPSQESTLDSIQNLEVGQIPSATGTGDLEYAGATKNPSTEEIGFDKATNFTQASLNISNPLTLSEATLDILLRDNVLNKNFTFPIASVGDDGTSNPTVKEAPSVTVREAQPVDTEVITTNPLMIPTLATQANETTVFVLRADQPMTNVRLTLTDVASGEIVKYIPDKISVESGANGLDFIVGDNIINLDSKLASNPASGEFNIGNTPLRSTAGEFGTILIEADNIALKGNSSGIPYVANSIKQLFSSDVALTRQVTHLEDNYTRLNAKYTSTDATTGGFVVTTKSTGDSDTVTNGQFTAGENGVSNPTILTDGFDTFTAGDILQISLTKLNNFYVEVGDHTGNFLQLKGVGFVGKVEGFTSDNIVTTVDSAVITKVEVAVVRSGLNGRIEQGKGSETPLVFTELYDQDSKSVVIDAYLSTNLLYDNNREEKIIKFDTVSKSNLISLGANGEIEALVSGRYEGHIILQINETSDPTIVVWNEIKPLATGVWEVSGGMAKTKFKEDASWTLTLDGSLELQAGDKVRVKAMMVGGGADKFELEGITESVDLGTLAQPSAHIDIIRVGALT